MMFLYFAYAVPLTRKISRGFYADGVWAENGFIPYHQIGGIAWRQGEPPTLLLISRFKEMARPLLVPGDVLLGRPAPAARQDRRARHHVRRRHAGPGGA